MKPARVILADVPHEYRNRHATRADGTKLTCFGIGVASRYNHGVMKTEDIASLPVAQVCADDAVLFFWTTWTHMQESLRIIDSWGFTYKTCGFVWVKTYPKADLEEWNEEEDFFGPGRYVPSNTEPCLFATRGKPWMPNTGPKPHQVCREPHPRGEDSKIIHSRKPEEIQNRIERWLRPHIGEGSFLELFATRQRPGWTCLGGDVTGNDIRQDLQRMSYQIEINRLARGIA